MEHPSNTYSAGPMPPRAVICNRCSLPFNRPQSNSPYWEGKARPELFAWPPRRYTWAGPHRVGPGSLLHGVKNGCYMCNYILKAAPVGLHIYAEYFRTFYEIRITENSQWLLQFSIEIPYKAREAGATPRVIECPGTFRLFPQSEFVELLKLDASAEVDEPGADPVSQPLSRKVEAESARQNEPLVKAWLKRCNTGHGQHSICKQRGQTKLGSSIRFLNLKAFLKGRLYLKEFAAGRKLPTYCTVSHSKATTGDDWHAKLTSESFSSLLNGFDSASLPNHLQDAIRLVHSIGDEYVWLDELCIIQDSEADKQAHRNVRGQIYQGTHCNICTAKHPSDDASSGSAATAGQHLMVRDPDSKSPSPMLIIEYTDFWCSDLLASDVHNRAETIPERLLSPRNIYLGSGQMMWECRAHKACEKYPAGIPEQLISERTRDWNPAARLYKALQRHEPHQSDSWVERFVSMFWALSAEDTRILHRHAYEFWFDVVQLFMQHKLGDGQTGLEAIEGISGLVKSITKEQYLAGLWNNDSLPLQLLWFVPRREQASGEPSMKIKGSLAPSWSWAALVAEIALESWINSDEILLGIDCVEDTDCTRIYATGHLIPVEIQPLHTFEDGTPNEDGSYAVLQRDQEAKGKAPSPTLPGFEPTVYLDESLAARPAEEPYLLPVCTGWRSRTGHSLGEVAGLILQKQMREGMTVYERLGVYALERSGRENLTRELGHYGDALTGVAGTTGGEAVVLV